jgi:hypothetical protein
MGGSILLPILLRSACSDDEQASQQEASSSASTPVELSDAPITIQFPQTSYTLYSQNELHGRFRVNCQDYFTSDDLITSANLQKCYKNFGVPSLEQSGLPQILEHIDQRTVHLGADSPEELAAIDLALAQAPDVELEASSTISSKDISEALHEHIDSHKDKGQPSFIENYRKLYEAPLLEYPSWLNPLHIPAAPKYQITMAVNEGVDFGPLMLRAVIDSHTPPTVAYRFHDSSMGIYRVSEPEEIHQAYSLAMHFEKDLENAATILHEHHPHIARENFRAKLYTRISEELASLDFEDPWQDAGACAFSDCSLDFESQFEDEEIGILRNGEVYDLSWRLGSEFVVDMKQQGFGPAQVILGLFLEAGQNEAVLNHYAGHLSKDDVKDEESALKTILENPVYSYALSLDHVLTELENTVFKDPVVRGTKTTFPYLQDDAAAREYSLLNTAALLVAYPEQDENAKELIISGTGGAGIEQSWSDVFQINPQYESMRVYRHEQPPMPHMGNRQLVFYVVSGDSE